MAKHVAKAHDDFRERIATKMLADAKLVPGVVRRDSRGRGIPDDDWWVGSSAQLAASTSVFSQVATAPILARLPSMRAVSSVNEG